MFAATRRQMQNTADAAGNIPAVAQKEYNIFLLTDKHRNYFKNVHSLSCLLSPEAGHIIVDGAYTSNACKGKANYAPEDCPAKVNLGME